MIGSNQSVNFWNSVKSCRNFDDSAGILFDAFSADVYKYSFLNVFHEEKNEKIGQYSLFYNKEEGALQSEVQKNTFDFIESHYFKTGYLACNHNRKNASDTAQSVLLMVYQKSLFNADAEALKALFSAVEGAFAEGDLKFVDNMLEIFDPKKVKKIVAVGILRSTFRVRSELKYWDSCLAKVAYVLIHNNQPAAHLLRGLYNNNGKPLLAKQQAV